MKSTIKNLRNIVPFVKEYSENVGKHGNQPLISTTDRSGNKMWMGNAVLARLNKNKIIRSPYNNSYCSGSFFVGYESDVKSPIFVQIQDRFPDLSEEAYRSYIEWVIKYSPWADAFLSHNINTVLKRRVAVIDGDKPKWLKKEAAIAIRMAWENYYNNNKYLNVGLWWELAQKTNPDISFIAGFLMTKEKDGGVILKSGESGHTPINYYEVGDNNYLHGWLKRNNTINGWEYSVRPRPIAGRLRDIIKSVVKKDEKVNPFSSSSSEVYNKDLFLEAMYSEIPNLEQEYVK